MILETLLWVIGLGLLFPLLRNSGAMGLFYLFGAFTAAITVRNVIVPWIRQRNNRKPGTSLRFNVYVVVILCLTLVVAVALFKKIEEHLHYDPPKPMAGNTGQVGVLVFDSNAERLASGGLDPMVRVWNPIANEHIRNLPAEGQSYYAGYPYLFTVVAYSPDGKLLATGSVDKSVRIWNTQNNKLETQLFCHTKPVRSIAFSPDKRWLASGGDDAQLCIWEISGWKLKLQIGQAQAGHSGTITALAFSPDSKYLASGSPDKFVKVWQTDNFTWKWTSNAHDQGVVAVAFTQDSKTILSVTDKGVLRRWTPEEKVSANIQQEFYKDKPETVTAVTFNKDATLVAISGLDRYIRVYETNPNVATASADKPKVRIDRQPENVTALAFHPASDKLVSGGKDNFIRLWDLNTAKEIRSTNLHNAEIKGLTFHPNGQVLASLGADRMIRFWQPDDDKKPAPIQGTTEEIVELAFSPDSSNLFSASRDGYVRMWKLENGMMEAEYFWNPSLITSLAVRPNQAQTVVAGNSKGDWRILSPEGVFPESHAYDDPVTSIAFAPDGSYFITGSVDKPLRVWDAGGKSIGEIKGLGGRITNLIFSPDGKTLAGSSENRKTMLWRFTDPKDITSAVAVPLPIASDLVTALVFSKDSQILVTGDNGGNIQLWDAASGRFLESLHQYPYPVMALGVDKENTVYAAGLTPDKPNIQPWKAGSIREELSQFTLSSVTKYLVGNETGQVFWSLLGGFGISASFVLLLIAVYSAVAARSLYMQYPGFKFGQAFQAVMSVTLGTHKIQQRVRNGELVDMHGAAGSLAAFGGPGVLIVEEGNVAILMQSGRMTRVVGMGITWLDYFERVHIAIPLNPQSGKFSVKEVATLDGITLREVEFTVRYRIDPGNQTSTSGAAYPYDEKLIREKIGSPEGGNWRWNPHGALDAAARDFIGQLRFEDVFAISGETRQQLINDIQNRLSEYAQNAGVRVLSVSIGTIRLPDEIKQALEEKKLAELNRQKAIIEAEAKKETLTRQGEGEALAIRLKEKEKNEMREKMLRDIIAPLEAAGGDKEMLQKFLALFERFLDTLDKKT